jgi:hypothetical protein
MADTREAEWVDILPDDDGGRTYAVGYEARATIAPDKADQFVIVTRITVQRDLPGLHCDLWRVCVWVGDTMIVEVPLHNTIGVGYKAGDEQ